LTIGLIASFLLFAACGSSDPEPPADAGDAAGGVTETPDAGDTPEQLPENVVADADFVLVADGIEPGVLGYGPQGGEVTSPGPTIRLKEGEAAKIVLHNVDVSPHDFVAVAKKKVDAKTLWGSSISEEGFVDPSSFASVTFTPDLKGSYYYVCTRAGHLDRGMWGRLIIK
jgi:FtsP/CotA-like multicopper oxidase with cupredoxin domain